MGLRAVGTALRHRVAARRRGLAALTVLLTAVGGIVAVGAVGGSSAAEAGQRSTADSCAPNWVTAWQTSPQAGPEAPVGAAKLAGRTLRMVLRPQATGAEVRVRLSNRYGRVPLEVQAASVARAGTGAGLRGGPGRPIAFGGRPDATIAPGADLVSDPVPFVAQVGQSIAVSMYLPDEPDRVATHQVALQTSYVSRPGDLVDTADGSGFTTPIQSWLVLTGVDVLVPRAEHAVVAVGDSITDGVGSDPGADDRWSDALADRLTAAGGASTMTVLNAGISRNQLLADDPAGTGDSPGTRFAHDVATASGVTDVVLHIGTNDIAAGRSAAEIIPGLERFADQARSAGLRVFLTTVTPSLAGPHGTPDAVAVRDAVNEWVRTQGATRADGVFDFAAAVADPTRPERLAPAYDSGDGLHLSPAGYRVLAGAVQLGELTGSPCMAGGDPAKVLVSGGR